MVRADERHDERVTVQQRVEALERLHQPRRLGTRQINDSDGTRTRRGRGVDDRAGPRRGIGADKQCDSLAAAHLGASACGQPATEDSGDVPEKRWEPSGERQERVARQLEEVARDGRDERRRARLTGEQCDLSDDRLIDHHAQQPTLEDVDAVAELTLSADHLSFGDVAELETQEDLVQLRARQSIEQRRVDIGERQVALSHSAGRSAVRTLPPATTGVATRPRAPRWQS